MTDAPHFLHYAGALWWRPDPHRSAHFHTREAFERLIDEFTWSPAYQAEIRTALAELEAWEAEHTEEAAA
jgi:hypothetical protein